MTFQAPTPTPPGLWRRTPPAIFPPIMGLFGLGLAWRAAIGAFNVPVAISDAILGATALLFVWAALAYAVKILRRPSALTEDLKILPGRAGVAAAMLCLYLLSLALTPLYPLAAWVVLVLGVAMHGMVILATIAVFLRGPVEQRRISPVWHLMFVGPVIAALAALGLDVWPLALAVGAATGMVAIAVWSVSLDQLTSETVPAPLRPLLAIHLAPAALLGLLANGLELDLVATGFAILSAVILGFLVIRAGWLVESGFSALWGAFTFPLAATATFWLSMGANWRYGGAVLLVAATLIVPWIAGKVIQAWVKGQLAIRTNASIA